MNPEKRSDSDVERVLSLAKQHPNRARGEFMARAITGKLTEDEISLSEKAVRDEMSRRDADLNARNAAFIVGDSYSLADVVCTAFGFRLELMSMLDVFKEYPAFYAWYDRMKSRESFQYGILDYRA